MVQRHIILWLLGRSRLRQLEVGGVEPASAVLIHEFVDFAGIGALSKEQGHDHRARHISIGNHLLEFKKLRGESAEKAKKLQIMFEINSDGGTSSDNGNFVDSTEPAGSSRRLSDMDEATLQKKRKDLADIAVWLTGLDATDFALDDPHDLCSGRAFSEILHKIDENFFNSSWLEKMPTHTSRSNIVVKRSNLRKLWRKISDLLTSQLNRQIPNKCRWSEIDERVDGIEETDLPVAVDLGMLVITIAHIGRTQQFYVEYSQSMSAKYPNEIQNVARMIQLVLAELPEVPNYLEVSNLDVSIDEPKEISMQESTSHNGNHSVTRRSSCDSELFEAQRDAHRKEKEQLQKEVERLTKALDAAMLNTSISSDSNDVLVLEKQNEELRAKRREAEERAHELEAQIEQHRASLKELTEENDSLRSGQKDLMVQRNELHSAQDEIEVWRTKANQLAADAELAKKREKKEVKELQQQVKLLNSRLEHHVKQSTIDEDNKESVVKLRTQIGTLKALNETLDLKVASSVRLQNELENKLIEYKERVNQLEERKEELTSERNSLQEQLVLKEVVTDRSLHDSMFESGNLSFEPFSEKPKLPLEIENKRLQERIQELEALEPLQGDIIKLKSRIGVLEEENLMLTKQKEDQQRELQELQEKDEKSQKTHVSENYLELKVLLEKNNVELERLREVEARAEDRVATLEDLVKVRSEELENQKELLHKAKSVIDELDKRSRPVGEGNGTSVHQFKEMQVENEQLRTKCEKLEIDLNTVSTSLEQENRLITSAAHDMVTNRANDSTMSMRVTAGSDKTGPQTLLESQKMSGALPWSIFAILMLLFAVFVSSNMYSAINAPPIA